MVVYEWPLTSIPYVQVNSVLALVMTSLSRPYHQEQQLQVSLSVLRQRILVFFFVKEFSLTLATQQDLINASADTHPNNPSPHSINNCNNRIDINSTQIDN